MTRARAGTGAFSRRTISTVRSIEYLLPNVKRHHARD